MAPPNHCVTNQLRQLIYYSLDCSLLSNALFLAGRLYAYEPRALEAAYLLALCHLRLGELQAAYDYSKIPGARGTHLGCSYVFAQACLGLEKYGEGVVALDRSRGLWSSRTNWNKHSDTRRQQLPDAAAVLCLRGKLLHAQGDHNRAVECYAEALKLNPFMWDGFVGLCDLGVEVRLPKIFKMTPDMTSALAAGSSAAASAAANATEEPLLGNADENSSQSNSQHHNPPSILSDPFSSSTNKASGDNRVKAALYEKLNGSTALAAPVTGNVSNRIIETPTGPSVAASIPVATVRIEGSAGDNGVGLEPPQAPMRKGRGAVGATGMSWNLEAPPRMKTSVAMSGRVPKDAEDADGAEFSISALLGPGITDRKRTASGQVAQGAQSSASSSAASSLGHGGSVAVNGGMNDPMAPPRRSVRLLNSVSRPQSKLSAASLGANGTREGREMKRVKAPGVKGRNGLHTVGRVVSGNRKHENLNEPDAKESKTHPPLTAHLTHVQKNATSTAAAAAAATATATNDRHKELESLQWLLDLFTKLGAGYYALSHFRCQEAVTIFNSISQGQRETPWVLAQIGRAYYEQAMYGEAEKLYSRIRSMAPSRLEDVEVYSTILWHLNREIDLAFLAHEAIEADRLSPQAWCAVGNSFSLQRDHDNALRCFRRATQLDPKFAYAFTLQGHEHVSNEEYDKATAAFRAGIAAEGRHYNAWYGLGKVFEKQGKYDVAEQHYRTASSINPTNAVLVCCIGLVLEKMKKPQQALDQYSRSCAMSPGSSLARFKKARVLMALGMFEQALDELTVLKDLEPDEANVHFSLGKVYKELRQKGNAIRHFTNALNLDPKASHHIKEVMEQMEDDAEEDGMVMG